MAIQTPEEMRKRVSESLKAKEAIEFVKIDEPTLISLSSEKWLTIKPTYGDSSEHLPFLLNDLYTQNGTVFEESLQVLFEHVYHQESTYESTIAVVPHLVHLFKIKSLKEQIHLLHVLGSLISRTNPYLNTIDEELIQNFQKSVSELNERLISFIDANGNKMSDDEKTITAVAYFLIIAESEDAQSFQLASIYGCTSNNLYFACPCCDKDFEVYFDISNGEIISNEYTKENEYELLPTDCAKSENHNIKWFYPVLHKMEEKTVSAFISVLFGNVKCLSCGNTFDIFTAIKNY